MGETPDATPEISPEPTAENVPEVKGDGYFLLIFADDADEAPKVHRCAGADQFAGLVNEHVLSAKHPLYAFGFKGARIQISAPSAVCTIDVDGKQIPIGEKGTSFEETGRIVPLQTSIT